jgi:type 1 glutamine amidotransferase
MKRKALLTLCLLSMAGCGSAGGPKQPGNGGTGGDEGTGGSTGGSSGGGGKAGADAGVAPGGSGGGGGTGGGGAGTGGSPDSGAGGSAPAADAGADAGPAIAPRVLIFTKTNGTVHVPGIAAASASIKAALTGAGIMSDSLNDAAVFTQAGLAKYTGVVMVSTSGMPFGTPGTAQMTALVEFVRGGGGLAGFHAASSTEYGATSAFNALLGAETKDQGGGFRTSDCYPEGMHPVVAKLPMPWRVANEEFYTFNGFNPDNKVVLRCNPATGTERIPIAWVREEGAGRVFYTSLGHYAQIWGQGEQFFTDHAMPAINWTLKR